MQQNIQAATEQLKARYQTYEEELAAFSAQKNSYFGKISWLRIGKLNQDNNTDQLDRQFLADVKALLGQIYQDVQPMEAQERERALKELFAFMLAPKPLAQKRTAAQWMFCAAESFLTDFLPLLTQQGRDALHQRYCKTHPKYSLTPNQQALLAAMEDC